VVNKSEVAGMPIGIGSQGASTGTTGSRGLTRRRSFGDIRDMMQRRNPDRAELSGKRMSKGMRSKKKKKKKKKNSKMKFNILN
jgi:hypothetical protein